MGIPSARVDLIELFEFVWTRFATRMEGLTDPEWAWHPVGDEQIGLRWRLDHITDLLAEDRNAAWFGLQAPADPGRPASGAPEALRHAERAWAHWRGLLERMDADALAAPMGPVAGPYADATRYSFALHIADELIHHTAEAALLRDLYAGTIN